MGEVGLLWFIDSDRRQYIGGGLYGWLHGILSSSLSPGVMEQIGLEEGNSVGKQGQRNG